MNLRFEVDQAECFRKGIDSPKSIITIDVDPSKLPQEERDLIANRLRNGIDVHRWTDGTRIKAEAPTYEALLAAVRRDEAQVDRGIQMHAQEMANRKKTDAVPVLDRWLRPTQQF